MSTRSPKPILPGDASVDGREILLFGEDESIEQALRDGRVPFSKAPGMKIMKDVGKAEKILRSCRPLVVATCPEGKLIMKLCTAFSISFVPLTRSGVVDERTELDLVECDRDVMSPPFVRESIEGSLTHEESFLDGRAVLVAGDSAQNIANIFFPTGTSIFVATTIGELEHMLDSSGRIVSALPRDIYLDSIVLDLDATESAKLFATIESHAVLQHLPRIGVFNVSKPSSLCAMKMDVIIPSEVASHNPEWLLHQLLVAKQLSNLRKFAIEVIQSPAAATIEIAEEDNKNKSPVIPETDQTEIASDPEAPGPLVSTNNIQNAMQSEEDSDGTIMKRGRSRSHNHSTASGAGMPSLLTRRSTRVSLHKVMDSERYRSDSTSHSLFVDLRDSMAKVDRLEQIISKQKRDLHRLHVERNELIWKQLRECKFQYIPGISVRPFRELDTPPLGSGSFSKVVEAVLTESKDLDRLARVAVKVIPKVKVKDLREVEQLNQEIQLLKVLHHPNIVRLIEVHHGETSVNMIMELVKGGTLFEFIQQNRAKKNEPTYMDTSRIILFQLFSAIEYIHNRGVCHRDIKTKNVLVTGNFDSNGGAVIKLADFGFATKFKSGKLLRDGVGTPGFCAPEVLRGERYMGPAVDIWSAGMVCACLLSLSEQALNAFKEQDEDIEEEIIQPLLQSLLSEECIALVEACIKLSASERPSAPEVLKMPFLKTIPSPHAESTRGEASTLLTRRVSSSTEALKVETSGTKARKHSRSPKARSSSKRQSSPKPHLPSLNEQLRKAFPKSPGHGTASLPPLKSPTTCSAYPL